jgi:hypothetical protein
MTARRGSGRAGGEERERGCSACAGCCSPDPAEATTSAVGRASDEKARAEVVAYESERVYTLSHKQMTLNSSIYLFRQSPGACSTTPPLSQP